MGKKLIYILGIGLILLSSIIYIDQRYFFNPVVFSKDAVTPYDWLDYERPLTMTYVNVDESRKTIRIKEEREIRNLIEALKESPQAETVQISSDIEGALKLSNSSSTLLEVYIYEDHWKVLKGDSHIHKMTAHLEKLINQY
ncbi:hypothetical protein [Halobacillus mangrovi]|uniref:Uncharacterized protein n=1 Tax=Halobacillus mangrovi TaxID=402384 RepID=A0A1W5ZYL5_9BACI|nr:hypothetical protein [Halobacillus mangrovi]ARI78354.1 hypothetical protein HM131_16600 [Halobacillus mangrovi]